MFQNHNSKASLASEMEFINSQLIRKHGHGNDDHVHHDHYNMGPFPCHPHMIPLVDYTDPHQASLFQFDHHHHELSAASGPIGFGGGDLTSHGSKKGKSSLPMSSEQLFNFASPSASDGTGFSTRMELGAGKKRKRKRNNNAVEKPKEVVHVRAKRGQATDSHSLAERGRREKINKRLRCLQDLVPGCNKTNMGMAVMLDVISNYIQSLHNQIEFLSMKLSATSNKLDFLEMSMQPTEHQGSDAWKA